MGQYVFCKWFEFGPVKTAIIPLKNWLFTTQYQYLMTLRKEPFENIVGQGENAG